MTQIIAPARLHLGFLDLHGGLGRRFGGLGVTLDEVHTRLSCRQSNSFEGIGPDSDRAVEYAQRLLHQFGLTQAVRIEVSEAIPRHAGLGSGTQLALSVGMAVNQLFDLNLDIREIATHLGRGARSGIGIGAFEQGGFLVDGGRSDGSQPPRIIAHHPFPAHWRIVLLLAPQAPAGLSGDVERTAFSDLPEFKPELAAHLCHLTLMRILPSLLESDLEHFARGVGELQRVIGEYFAPAQGGAFLNPEISSLLTQARLLGFEGVGQSSWGPTGFILTDSETQAHMLARQLQPVSDLEIRIVSASTQGYRLMPDQSEQTASQRQAS